MFVAIYAYIWPTLNATIECRITILRMRIVRTWLFSTYLLMLNKNWNKMEIWIIIGIIGSYLFFTIQIWQHEFWWSQIKICSYRKHVFKIFTFYLLRHECNTLFILFQIRIYLKSTQNWSLRFILIILSTMHVCMQTHIFVIKEEILNTYLKIFCTYISRYFPNAFFTLKLFFDFCCDLVLQLKVKY